MHGALDQAEAVDLDHVAELFVDDEPAAHELGVEDEVVDGEADGDARESPRESPSRSASFSLWDANRLRSFTSMSLLSLTSDSSEWAACEDDKELEGDYGWYEDITHGAL